MLVSGSEGGIYEVVYNFLPGFQIWDLPGKMVFDLSLGQPKLTNYERNFQINELKKKTKQYPRISQSFTPNTQGSKHNPYIINVEFEPP